ncbi:MAG: c-type cytochrome [Janthinobacterium lividum]
MRTNYAGFALAVGMGLVALLIGLLALSAAGLTNLAPALAAADSQTPADTVQYVPITCGNVYMSSVPTDPAEAKVVALGDELFKNNCTQCHAVNEKVVGPALAGITRRRSISWLIPWVHNSTKVIAAGDEYAVKLYNDNGKQQMTSFPQLSDKDIVAIMSWVESQSAYQTVPAVAVVE